jgi:hypothetical protein
MTMATLEELTAGQLWDLWRTRDTGVYSHEWKARYLIGRLQQQGVPNYAILDCMIADQEPPEYLLGEFDPDRDDLEAKVSVIRVLWPHIAVPPEYQDYIDLKDGIGVPIPGAKARYEIAQSMLESFCGKALGIPVSSGGTSHPVGGPPRPRKAPESKKFRFVE